MVELFFFRKFGEEFLALSLSLLFGLFDFLLFFVGFGIFGVFFAAFFILFLLFTFFPISEFSWTDFAFEEFEFGHSDGVSEEPGIGFVSGFPLIRNGVNPMDFELGLD